MTVAVRLHNPYLLPPQSVVSFSGGRTSGYMLRQILDAHDEAGVPYPVTVFDNTGKEREETLEFVDEIDRRWGAGVRWLEYRWEPGRHYFALVDFTTASREGEPFEQVIQARGFLPNPVMRFCTAELKIRTTNRFVRQVLGWDTYHNAIGLRADEMDRVMKMRSKRTVRTVRTVRTLFGDEKHVERGACHPPGEVPVQPLYDAGATLADVMAFWTAQPFDLGLRQDEGNCDLCFLKGAGKLVGLIRERPEAADWWAEMETRIQHRDRPETGRFRADRPPYKELALIAADKQDGPGWLFQEQNGIGCDEGRCTD